MLDPPGEDPDAVRLWALMESDPGAAARASKAAQAAIHAAHMAAYISIYGSPPTESHLPPAAPTQLLAEAAAHAVSRMHYTAHTTSLYPPGQRCFVCRETEPPSVPGFHRWRKDPANLGQVGLPLCSFCATYAA